jgi:hypothetical protein
MPLNSREIIQGYNYARLTDAKLMAFREFPRPNWIA